MTNPSEAATRSSKVVAKFPFVSGCGMFSGAENGWTNDISVCVAEAIDKEFASELEEKDRKLAIAIKTLQKYAGLMEMNRQTRKWEPMAGLQRLAKDTLKQLGIPLEEDGGGG